ncbi:MAG: CHAT domain-containing protein, partial [Snowella sp.]|nr:CHAT domain-containing protein [Snowella sp.]
SDITFADKVNSQSGEANDLTLSSGAGNVSFNNSVGETNALGNLSVNSSGTTRFNNPVNAASLTTDEAGSTQINSNITTTGNQAYNDTVTLTGNATLTGSDITLQKTVEGNQDLTVNASGTSRFNDAVNVNNLTTDSTGTTEIKGNISTTGNQSYNDVVTLTGNATLTGSDITLQKTVEGNQDLTVNASGISRFNDAVNVSNLTTDAVGTTEIKGNISTTGNQTYNDSVTLTGNATLTGSDITLQKTVEGNQDLTVNASGISRFNDAVNVNNLTTDSAGSSQINGNITTTGSQTYNDPLIITNNPILTSKAGIITIKKTNITGNLTLTTDNLEIEGNVSGNSILTLQPYSSSLPITLGDNFLSDELAFTLSSTEINQLQPGFSQILIGQKDGSGQITVGSNVNFKSPVILRSPWGGLMFNDTVDLSGELTTDAPITINASINTGDNPINFNNSVTFAKDTTLNAGKSSISLKGTVTANNQNITFIADEIDWAGEIQGTGKLTFQPSSAGRNILSGSTSATDPNALNLTNTELSLISPTFSSVTIGNNNSPIIIAEPIAFNFNLNLAATNNTITVNQAINTKGTLTLNGSTNLNADLTTQGQNLTINGNVNLGNAANISTGDRGNINITGDIQGSYPLSLQAGENLNAQNIDLSNKSGTGATLALNAPSGTINTGNLNTAGSNNGGDITIKAKTAITTGAITTSGEKAGNVFIDPDNDVQVGYINAQSTNGVGGNIDITTARFFRATETFVDQNGVVASISSAGSQGGGTITIRYGGNGTTPFIVGNASENGTQGAITSGEYTINPTQPYLFNETKGNISLSSGIQVPIADSQVPIFINPPNQRDSKSQSPEPVAEVPSQPSISPSTPTPVATQKTTAAVVEGIDRSFTTDYSNQLGIPAKPEIPLDTIPTILTGVQQVTGIKSALIYVFFRPAKSDSSIENSSLWELNRARNSTANTERNDDDELEMVLVSDQNILSLPIKGVTRGQVLKMALRLQQELINMSPTENFLPEAKQLYQWLIEPIEDALKNQKITNLTFILDQGLRSLPLAALYDANSQQYIIEKYSVSLTPSLALTDTTRQDRQGAQVLGMGADNFSDQKPLPAVPIELTEIATKIWPGQIFLNQDFTVENFKRALNSNQFSIVHLATHGEFKSGDRNNSFVVFSDRKLTLDEFANLGLDRPIDLLTLSACKTAVGDFDAELGFAGLAVKTGVRTALGSLWYVSDEGTLALMTSFYNQLKQSPTKADALRQAQLNLLHRKVSIQNDQMVIGDKNNPLTVSVNFSLRRNLKNIDLSHPYYWSSFTMIGNPW